MRHRKAWILWVALVFLMPDVFAAATPVFGSLSVTGNRRVSERTIIAESWLREGAPFSVEALREAEQRIRNLVYIITVESEVRTNGVQREITFEVREQHSFYAFPQFSLEGFENRVGFSLVERAFGGSDERIGLGASYGDDGSWFATANYFDRYIRGAAYNWGASAFAQRAKNRDAGVTEVTGVTASGGYWINDDTRVFVGGAALNYDSPPSTDSTGDGESRDHRVIAGLNYNGLDFHFPTHYAGSVAGLRMHQSITDVGGDYATTRASVFGEHWYTVFDDHTVVARGFAGAGSRFSPFSNFRTGGLGSVRGYEQQTQSGSASVAGSLEYRVPVGQFRVFSETCRLTLLGFVDRGTSTTGNLREADYLTGVGGGARVYFDHFQAIRILLDVGQGLDEESTRIHFAIGGIFDRFQGLCSVVQKHDVHRDELGWGVLSPSHSWPVGFSVRSTLP